MHGMNGSPADERKAAERMLNELFPNGSPLDAAPKPRPRVVMIARGDSTREVHLTFDRQVSADDLRALYEMLKKTWPL